MALQTRVVSSDSASASPSVSDSASVRGAHRHRSAASAGLMARTASSSRAVRGSPAAGGLVPRCLCERLILALASSLWGHFFEIRALDAPLLCLSLRGRWHGGSPRNGNRPTCSKGGPCALLDDGSFHTHSRERND